MPSAERRGGHPTGAAPSSVASAADPELPHGDAATDEARPPGEGLVHLHLPLVEHCARRFRNRGEPFEDLVQVGTIGLLKSIDRFDLERGVEFSTYATPTIIGEIKRHFRDKGWAIRVPAPAPGAADADRRGQRRADPEPGPLPHPRELAERIGCSVEDILEGIESSNAYSTLSLDASDDDEDGAATHARRDRSTTRTSSTSRSASRSSRCSTGSTPARSGSCCCGSSRT